MSFVIPELWLKSEVNPLRNKKVRADLPRGGPNTYLDPPLIMSVYWHFKGGPPAYTYVQKKIQIFF